LKCSNRHRHIRSSGRRVLLLLRSMADRPRRLETRMSLRMLRSRKLRLQSGRNCETGSRMSMPISGGEHTSRRSFNIADSIRFGSNDRNTFTSVQALYITPDDSLWILDTERPTTNEPQAPSMPCAAPGGLKLVVNNFRTTRSLHLHASAHRSLPRLIRERPGFRYASKRHSFRWRNCIHCGLEQ
jgi:hypothetical protein